MEKRNLLEFSIWVILTKVQKSHQNMSKYQISL